MWDGWRSGDDRIVGVKPQGVAEYGVKPWEITGYEGQAFKTDKQRIKVIWPQNIHL